MHGFFSLLLLLIGYKNCVPTFRANKNVTLTLSWNVIPNAGTLPKVKATGSFQLQFPDEYSVSQG